MDNLQNIEHQLNRIENSIAASKEVLTFDETAQLTGLSKSYLYKLTSGGMIPHSKPMGKNMFFSRSEVEAWLMSKPVKTSAEISVKAATYTTLNSVGGNDAVQLQLSGNSKKDLLKTFLNEKRKSNYILLVIVLMFAVIFFLGCYLTFYYRDQPERLMVLCGGTFLPITIICGLQRLWLQKSHIDYLIILIQNFPADRIGEIIQTILFEGK